MDTEEWHHWGLRGSTRADVANVSRVRAALEEGASVGGRVYKPLQERLSGPNDFQLSLAADELELSRLTG